MENPAKLALLCSIAAIFCICAVSACVSPAPQSAPPVPRAAAAEPSPVSYDWHALVLVPFGTLLKDSPLPLHEVLLFHDAVAESAGEERDCYGLDGTLPQFANRRADDYMLCFEHDRLNRIEATLRLPAASAAQTFATACGQWLRTSAPAASSPAPGACEGRDGATGFSARLRDESEQSAERPQAAPAQTVSLSISLFSVAEP